jgi:hypothetical protein
MTYGLTAHRPLALLFAAVGLIFAASRAFPQAAATNQHLVTSFIGEDLLRDVKLTSLFPADQVLRQLGARKGETVEKADLNYEGVTVSRIRKVEYQRFYAIVYKLDNGMDVFGYLELKPQLTYTRFNYGTPLENSIDISGDGVSQVDDHTYTVYGTYNGDWDASVTVEVDADLRIQKVTVDIGGI